MLSYCLKCKKKMLRTLIQEFQRLAMVKQQYYQSVLYVVLKNQNLLKKKKEKDY